MPQQHAQHAQQEEQKPRTPTETIKPTPMELLNRILGNQLLVEGFMNLFEKNVHELTPDAKELLDNIWLDPRLFSGYVRLVSRDESLLTPNEIVLRNRFLQICPNVPNPQQQPRTPTKTIKPTPMEHLTRILGDSRLVEGFMNLFKTNVHELTPDAKELLDEIWLDPYLFSEYVRLVSTDESLLTPDGIVLRNRFLLICPNVPNLL
jgi:outer membrane protein OmpA-like peptidoglycan-associated protein